MFLLLGIYGLTVTSTGLVVFSLFPELQAKLKNYFTVQSRQSSEQLAEMFIDMPLQRLQLIYGALPIIGGIILWLTLGVIWAVPLGIGMGFLVPRWWVKFLEFQRRQKFQSQLVDALMVMSSSMKAGLSLIQAMEVLVEEAIAPMSQEVGLVVKEIRMGLALEESLRRLKQRMPVEELHLVVTTILVARETGGDVTTVFAKLVETIRERFKIKERIKTLTVIPRLQGWIMAILPFAFGFFATRSSPGYFDIMLKDPVGNMFLALAGFLWVMSLALIAVFSRPPK